MSVWKKRRNLEPGINIVEDARTCRLTGLVVVPFCLAGAVLTAPTLLRPMALTISGAAICGMFAYQAILWSVITVRAWPIARMDPFHVPPGTKLPSASVNTALTIAPFLCYGVPMLLLLFARA